VDTYYADCYTTGSFGGGITGSLVEVLSNLRLKTSFFAEVASD
jgi:hypothetical protein